MLAFFHTQNEPMAEQRVFPEWVISMRGFHTLLEVPEVLNRLQESAWQPVLQSCDTWHEKFDDRVAVASQEGSSQAIRALLKYSSLLPAEDARLYEERINCLMTLERCNPAPKAINALASFVSHSPPAYIAKLKRGDAMSLLLLLYWCRLFSRTGQWWLVQSATAESDRLYAEISGAAGSNEMRQLLDIVATYTL
jgi:hypothetical protein